MEDIRDYKPVKDFLLDISIYDPLEEVAKKHGVELNRVDEFLQLTDAVVQGKLDPKQMPDMLAKAFGKDDQAAKKLAADVAGYALLPLERYIPGLTDLIASWGGVIAEYPTKRVGKEKTSPDRFVEDLAKKLDLQLPTALMNRFTYLASGYLTKKRAKDATKKILMRRINLGGLEFTEPMVENFFKVLDEEGKHMNIVEAQVEKGQGKTTQITPPTAKPEVPKVSKRAKSVPDLAQVQKKKRLPTKEEILAHARSLVSAPKTAVKKAVKVAKAAKVAARDTFTSTSVKPDKSAREKMVNERLAPVVKMFQDKGLSGVAFKDISVGFIKDERSDSETHEQLTTVHGFTDQEAGQIMKALVQAKAAATSAPVPRGKIISKRTPIERDFAITLPEVRDEKMHAVTTSVPVISGLELQKDEEEDVKAAEKQVKRSKSGKVVDSPSKDVQESVNKALQPMATVLQSNNISKKVFGDIARAFIKGIREPHQTERLLKEKYQLKDADIEIVLKSLKQAKVVTEAGMKPSGDSLMNSEASHTLEAEEKDVLNRRHAAVTGKIAKDDVKPILPHARVSAARTKEEELALQKGEITPEQLKKAQEASRPQRASAKVSSSSVVGNQKVTDVKFAKRLTGPVEELGTMTPAEFRRLSSDPKEASRKVMDKLDLLESTAYEERIRGVKAWRKSPMNTLYLKMANEALTKGKAIAEVAAERRNDGEESLSPAEIRAVVELNSQIKF